MPGDVSLWLVAALAAATAGVGSLGGLGGAVLLVPTLVLVGVSPVAAAPLGLLTVAAGSLAASAQQLRSGLVHERLGVVTESTAVAGALAGALVSALVPGAALAVLLGLVAIAAGVAGLAQRGLRNPPQAAFVAEAAGEWPGTLGGVYRLGQQGVPYQARRVPLGLACTGGAGLLAGLVGVGGGFVKTPVMREIMGIPIKVAAATSLFTVGITAAAGLTVYAAQGRIDVHAGAAAVIGALVGGRLGGLAQTRLPPTPSRVVVACLLVAIGVVLIVRA